MNLDVYIDSWVISDGNYEHFREGEIREFALEFYALHRLATVASVDKQLEVNSEYTYDVTAEIVLVSEDICVLDFGLAAYSESGSTLDAGYRVGDLVKGKISFGVDPFFYFERLSKIPGVPPLIYEWCINSVEQDTSPSAPTDVCRRQGYAKDESRRSFRRVRGTFENVTVSPETVPLHVLHCTKLDTPPSNGFRHR